MMLVLPQIIQTLLVLTQILYGKIVPGQAKTVSSFGGKIVSLETASILMSFISMGRSFYRIRNRNKKNALNFKSALTIFLLTTRLWRQYPGFCPLACSSTCTV